MDWSDIRVTIALLGPAIGFGIWLYKRWLVDLRDERRRAKGRENLVRALYAEIDFNTRDMERFVDNSPSAETLRKVLSEYTELVPHITDARHTEIYRSRITDVHNVVDGVLHQTIEFYGLLEKIRSQIEGINYSSYTTLTLEGRLNAVEVIRRTAMDARVCGLDLLARFEMEYSNMALVRYERHETGCEEGDLRKRLTALEAKLQAKRHG